LWRDGCGEMVVHCLKKYYQGIKVYALGNDRGTGCGENRDRDRQVWVLGVEGGVRWSGI